SALLATHLLVQLYDRVRYLAPMPIDPVTGPSVWRTMPWELERSGAAVSLRDPSAAENLRAVAADDLATLRNLPCKGLAWAARRDLLEHHPLFDVWIVGGGDSAYFYAALGCARPVVERHGLAPGHREHFLPRARALSDEVAGRIGFVPGTVYHLW